MNEILHPVEVERSVLGNLLLKEGTSLHLVEELLGDGSWGSQQHANLFAWVRARQRDGRPISIMSLLESADPHELHQRFGGTDYIETMADRACMDAQLVAHAGMIGDAARGRSLRSAMEGTLKRLGKDEGIDEVLADHEQAVMKITSGGSRITSVRHISDHAREAQARSRRMAAGETDLEYVHTGLTCFDEAFIGIPIGYPTIIGGRPASGKTSLMSAIAVRGASEKHGNPVPQGIISIEMPAKKLLYRLAATWSGVCWKRILRGQADASECQRFDAAFDELGRMPIFIDDTVWDIRGVLAAARRMARMHGCKVVYVDYFQLIKVVMRNRNDNQVAGLDALSDQLRALAKSEEIALVILSQLNQECEKRKVGGRRGVPRPGDFRGTDKLLQDAALALGVYRVFAYHPPDRIGATGKRDQDELAHVWQPMELINMKAREGGKSVELYTMLATGQVVDLQDPGVDITPWEPTV